MKTIPQQILEGQPAVLTIDDAAALMGVRKAKAMEELGQAVFEAEGEVCVLRDDLADYWEQNPGKTWITQGLDLGWSRKPKPVTVKDHLGFHPFPSMTAARRVYGRGIDKVPGRKRQPRKFIGIEVYPGIVLGTWTQGELILDIPRLYRIDAALVGTSVFIGIRRAN